MSASSEEDALLADGRIDVTSDLFSATESETLDILVQRRVAELRADLSS